MTTKITFTPSTIYANNGAETWSGSAWRTATAADLAQLVDTLSTACLRTANASTYGYLWMTPSSVTAPAGTAWDNLVGTPTFSGPIQMPYSHKLSLTLVGSDATRVAVYWLKSDGSVVTQSVNSHPGTGSNDLRTFAQSNMRILWEAGDGTGSNASTWIDMLSELTVSLQQYARPTLTVTAPSPISGATVANTLRPTITWTFTGDTNPNGSGTIGQAGYRVRIFSAAQYGAGGFDPLTSTSTYDSGDVTSSASSHTVMTNLTNGTTYRAYVVAWSSLPQTGFLHTTIQDTTLGALGSTQYTQFTITLTAPPAPTAITPANLSTVTTDIPTLGATLTASSIGSPVRGEWQLATDAGFSNNVRTFTEAAGDARTSGATSEAVPAGASELYQTTWYMRARELDNNGLYSAYATTQSFTVSHAPSAVPASPVSQASVAYGSSIGFTWTFSDPSSTDYQTAYQVIVERDSDGLQLWDSGKTTSAISAAIWTGITSAYKDVLLRWRVRVYDSDDVVSSYSANQQFYARDAPVVAITYPTAGAGGLVSPQPTVTWTFTATSGRTQTSFDVVITNTATGATVYDSGWKTSSATSWDVGSPILTYGVSYTVTVYVRDSVGLQVATSVTASALWTPPNNPTVTVSAANYDSAGYISLTWAQNRDAQYVNYQVWRRPTGTTTWTLVATIVDLVSSTLVYYDYYAPNVPLDYAVTQTALRYGVNVGSTQSANSVTPNGTHYWLICYNDTSLSVRLANVADDGWTDIWEQQEITLIGRGRRVERGTHYGKSGSLTAKVRDITGLTARQARLNIEAMKSAGTLAYLRTPFGDVFKVVAGDIGVKREAGVATNEYFELTLPYMEVT